MRHLPSLVLFAILFGGLLAACNASTPETARIAGIPSSSPYPLETTLSMLSSTATISPITRSTQTETIVATRTPTQTPLAARDQTLTAWALPISTEIPTETFDVRSIRSSTPEPAAQCPQIRVEQVPTLDYKLHPVYAYVFTDYLNNYGADAFLLADQRAQNDFGEIDPHVTMYRDLTNDGIPEIVAGYQPLYIFGCKYGQYQALLALEPSVHGTRQEIVEINDLNKNGIPEFLVLNDEGTQAGRWYSLYEWGNGQFNPLFRTINHSEAEDGRAILILPDGEFQFRDIDEDGLKEIVLYDGTPLPGELAGGFYRFPWRRKTDIFKWNGVHFALTKSVFDPPQYRFQAVVDADYASIRQDYDQALELYYQVIYNNKLEWWTKERERFQMYNLWLNKVEPYVTVTPPAPDPNEYLYLSAYARFRIMVLHLMRGYADVAQEIYQTLLEKSPEGTPGSIYASMATAFWHEYQSTRSIGLACGKARAVAIDHEDDATRYLLDDHTEADIFTQRYTVDQLCIYK